MKELKFVGVTPFIRRLGGMSEISFTAFVDGRKINGMYVYSERIKEPEWDDEQDKIPDWLNFIDVNAECNKEWVRMFAYEDKCRAFTWDILKNKVPTKVVIEYEDNGETLNIDVVDGKIDWESVGITIDYSTIK